MKMMLASSIAGVTLAAVGVAHADPYRLVVTIENLAPQNSTFQTPHWVGFHDGNFDIYDGGTPADNDPVPGDPRKSVERLAEDGNTGPLTETFNEIFPEGVDGTIPGADGALAPGEVTSMSFLLDAHNPNHRFFSYASMVLPSNDSWYANGNPMTHPVFDEQGNFVAEDFFVSNLNLLDAGTEVNDEIPMNTAFFGQEVGNTGEDENGVIKDFLDDDGNAQLQFMPRGSGGILDDERFSMADFSLPGYPVVKISFKAMPALLEDHRFVTKLTGDHVVPSVNNDAFGLAKYRFKNEDSSLSFVHLLSLRTDQIIAADLHMGEAGVNGPVVASLLDGNEMSGGMRRAKGGARVLYISVLKGVLESSDLVGPLKRQPLEALIEAIKEGKIYVSVRTKAYPDGVMRGQLSLEGG